MSASLKRLHLGLYDGLWTNLWLASISRGYLWGYETTIVYKKLYQNGSIEGKSSPKILVDQSKRYNWYQLCFHFKLRAITSRRSWFFRWVRNCRTFDHFKFRILHLNMQKWVSRQQQDRSVTTWSHRQVDCNIDKWSESVVCRKPELHPSGHYADVAAAIQFQTLKWELQKFIFDGRCRQTASCHFQLLKDAI